MRGPTEPEKHRPLLKLTMVKVLELCRIFREVSHYGIWTSSKMFVFSADVIRKE
jgi:hypothetical protein